MRRAIPVAALIYGVLLCISLAYLFPKMHRARHEGFRARQTNGSLVITSAEPWTNLRAGDRILEFNGDPRIRLAGIVPFLMRYPSGVPYRLRLQRGSEMVETTLQIAEQESWVVAENSFLLVVGILCCLMSTWIGWRDPDSPMVRIAWVSGMMAALQMLSWGLEAAVAGGWPPGPAAYALFWVSPWKLYATYLFAAALPTGKPETGRWRWLQWSLLALTVAAQLESLPHDLAHLAVPGETGIRLGQFAGSLLPRPPLWEWSTTIFSVSMIVLVWRNYRRLDSEDGRRRVRWVVFGMSTAAGCLVAAEILVSLHLAGPLLRNTAQLTLVLIPLTLGYAIMRHRVLGVSVVVRRSLQYLLARHFTGALMLAVPAVLATRGILHPTMTLRELIDPPLFYGGTLALACLAFLARPWLIDALDRRFFREVWDREQILSGLLDTIRRQYSFRDTVEIVRQDIQNTLHPDGTEIFYRTKRAGQLESPGGETIPEDWLLPTGRMVWRREEASDGTPLEKEWLAQRNVEMLIAIPSVADAAGVLLLGAKKSEEPYTGRDIQLLRAIAEHLGLAHENHLLAIERAEAVVVERTRIARELHDTLAQGFAGISLHLESARLSLTDAPAEAGSHIEQARSLARSSLAEARRSVYDLRDQAREASTLRQELVQLANSLTCGTGIEVQVDAQGEMPLPQAVRQNLFRIAQESITNALKHSGATRIQVMVEFGSAGVRLRIRDNGRGFDPEEVRPAGFGLVGMKERAAEMQGRLEVRSAAGAGTEVCAFAQFA